MKNVMLSTAKKKNHLFQLNTVAASLVSAGAVFLPDLAFAQTDDSNPASVVVVGRSGSGTYEASEISGTKSGLPVRELPQSVRVMTRQAIDDLGATRLDEVLDFVGGVSRQNSFGGLWDNFAIRGLPGNENTGMPTLLNGFSGNRGFNAPRDMAQVERIEFLKGPVASLYGTSEPGGTLNIVTKAPRWKSAHSAEVYAGSFNAYRTAIDTTGPLSKDLAYRINAAAESRGSFRNNVNSERQVFAPALTFKLAPGSTIEYTGEWLRHKAPLDRGIIEVNRRLDAIPSDRFLGEPNDGNITVENLTNQLALHHQWNPDWQSRFALSYRTTALNGFSTEPTSLQADSRTLRRQRRFRDYDSSDIAVQAELSGKFKTHDIAHDVLIGAEAYRFNFDQVMLRVNPTAGAPYAIDVFNPVYGQPQPAPLPNTSTDEQQRNLAFYVQDGITLTPQWRLLAGLRIDHYKQDFSNRRTAANTSQSQNEMSPRVGFSWLPAKNWTIYTSASTSFRPNSGAQVNGASFDPEKGRALELGVKWESTGKDLGATAAVFDIKKRNALTADPANPGYQITTGEVASQGIEFDFAGQLTQQWRVNASFVANNAEITKDNTLEVGSRILNVPRINGSVLAVYESVSHGGRYGIGGGLTYVGKRLGQSRTQAPADLATPAFELPSYTTAKLVAYWRISETLRLSLDIDNVFNKSYYTNSYSRVWVSTGSPRSITLGLQAKF